MNLKRNIFCYLFMLNSALLILPALTSCNSNSDVVNPTGSNVQLQVLNLSPDSYPIELFINNIRVNTAYRYNTPPTYFFLNDTNNALQLRSTRTDDRRIFTRDEVSYQPNTRYSIFFTGLYADSTLRSIVTVDDTASLPPVGKGGKIRFVNASLRATNFDIWANGAVAIKSTAYGAVSNYVTLPAGNYNFSAYVQNTTSNSLAILPNVTIQDGRLYTLYSRGLVGRANTDTASFGLAVLANNPPKI
jgi:hypothetical protein